MGFWTDLHFYRPTRPPLVTGRELSSFVERLSGALPLERERFCLYLKFGAAVDQDERTIGSYNSKTDLDIKLFEVPKDEIVAAISSDDRHVYRAFVSIGRLASNLTRTLQTARPDDNEENISLEDVNFSVGPVSLYSLATGSEAKVGWMRLSLSGDGYLWPWKPRELTERVAQLAELKSACQLCRETFPIANPNADFDLEARRKMRDLWTLPELNHPWDWFWGTRES